MLRLSDSDSDSDEQNQPAELVLVNNVIQKRFALRLGHEVVQRWCRRVESYTAESVGNELH